MTATDVSPRLTIELRHPSQKFRPRVTADPDGWLERQAKLLPLGTTAIIRTPSGGTIQYQLVDLRRWKFLRQTWGTL